MGCTCGYEARSEQDLQEHIVAMSSSLGINDPNEHFPRRRA